MEAIMTTTLDLHAAQPTFSDRELEVLLRALNIAGDVHNERDREHALQALGVVLLDGERSEQVLSALSELDGPANDPASVEPSRNGVRPRTISRRSPNPDSNPMRDDEPSTGRLLNALHARTHGAQPGTPDAGRHWLEGQTASAVRGQLFVTGGGRYTAVENVIIRAAENDHVEHEHFRHFLVKAREALSEPAPSLFVRLGDALDALRGVTTSRTWPAARFVSNVHLHTVNVFLSHGHREWRVDVLFLEPKVKVCVTNENTTVIEQDVGNAKPEEFSKTLLHAFDGDIRSTQMALDAVQQAIAVDGRAVH